MNLIGPASWKRKRILIDTGISAKVDLSLRHALKKLFRKQGSDKSSQHTYEYLYSHLLPFLPHGNILEVGIGTQNRSYQSSMPSGFTPGGSLTAWKKLQKFSHVFGADLDPGTLFQESGISTLIVDQLSRESLSIMREKIAAKGGCSLVIDDGLHTLEAARNTVQECWPLLLPSGVIVVEDVHPDYLGQLINVVSELQPSSWGFFADVLKKADNIAVFARK